MTEEAKTTIYTVYKLVEGEWCYEGKWTNPESLAECMFNLGKHCGCIDEIRIETNEE